MDLETISAQMNSVIHKHQMVVKELKSDPQNAVLLKKLHELQCEIRSLNDRQKQVVEGLRKNLEKPSPNTCSTNVAAFTVASQSPRPQTPNQETQVVGSQRSPLANNKLTTTLVTKPITNCINTVRQTVPPTINNIATPAATTFTFKAPMGTVVLPNCSTAAASTLLTTKVAEHQKIHPVLVVPSPSNRTADGAQVLLNLVPPIRVPQYPPPSPRTPAPPVTCQKNTAINSCNPIAVANTSTTFQTTQFYVNSDSSCDSPPATLSDKFQPNNTIDTIENKLEQKKKLEFLTALGLVTRDSLCDLKNKRMERKRRSTANPQFSNAALEEKWRIAAAAQASTAPQKRPRGRPRLETKPVVCPTNGICPANEDKPAEVQPPQNNAPIVMTTNSCSVNSTPAVSSLANSSPNSSPINSSVTVVNGIHKALSHSDEGKNVEQMLSGLCIVCTQPGDLVKCDTCAKQQHLGCMQPPLIARPQVPWQCSECQSRTVSLTVVQNYDMLKAAKEDEKRKLLKKSLELRLKRSQLEGRLNQLKDYSTNQKNRQSELQNSLKGTENLVERISNVINGVRMCS
ncbi:PHD finger protein 21A isoform X2 [Parasteatoda tepidariorum]|uniref:PHD finger protein 21A isoform X2 n=1 Tax=Parasteatoda tepidariorum TaxID=114398 RepID=UPI00077FABEB|nr:PHD finger protein 21A isoform X2 [Parasteatoda tepidariorum]